MADNTADSQQTGAGKESLDIQALCAIIHEILQEFVLIFDALRDIEAGLDQDDKNFEQTMVPFLHTMEAHIRSLEVIVTHVDNTCDADNTLLQEVRGLSASIHSILENKDYGLDRIHRQLLDLQLEVSKKLENLSAAMLSDTTGWGAHVATGVSTKNLVEAIDKKLWRLFALLGAGASAYSVYNLVHWLEKLCSTVAQ